MHWCCKSRPNFWTRGRRELNRILKLISAGGTCVGSLVHGRWTEDRGQKGVPDIVPVVQTDYCQIVHLCSLISKLKSISLPCRPCGHPGKISSQCWAQGSTKRAQSKFIAPLCLLQDSPLVPPYGKQHHRRIEKLSVGRSNTVGVKYKATSVLLWKSSAVGNSLQVSVI